VPTTTVASVRLLRVGVFRMEVGGCPVAAGLEGGIWRLVDPPVEAGETTGAADHR
jgi:hypothetical protein